jgi:hypothetical protein
LEGLWGGKDGHHVIWAARSKGRKSWLCSPLGGFSQVPVLAGGKPQFLIQLAIGASQLAQETRAKHLEQKMRSLKLKVGDLVLLCTEHYNLQLPSQKLATKWLGPLKVELRGPNTVLVETHPSSKGEPEALSPPPPRGGTLS